MLEQVNRRSVLKGAVALGGLAAAGGLGAMGRLGLEQADSPAAAPRRRSVRLAHLTDFHIQPERHAFDGVATCLHHVQALPDKPELIVTGGDLIMDAFEHDQARTRTLWEGWTKVLKNECSMSIEHCLGNHDIWGWNKGKSGTSGSEPGWGKKWALDVLEMPRPYHTFDRAGWRVVVLDSVYPDGDGYMGRLDEEQFEWLRDLLVRTSPETHVLVVSHIPIMSITALAAQKPDVPDHLNVSRGSVHVDGTRLLKLFGEHPNVRACLSGHMHEIERIDYQGVTYLCNGAVSGGWWKGRNRQCDEGYAVVDLFDDGVVERAYQTYGWKAQE